MWTYPSRAVESSHGRRRFQRKSPSCFKPKYEIDFFKMLCYTTTVFFAIWITRTWFLYTCRHQQRGSDWVLGSVLSRKTGSAICKTFSSVTLILSWPHLLNSASVFRICKGKKRMKNSIWQGLQDHPFLLLPEKPQTEYQKNTITQPTPKIVLCLHPA